MDSDDDGDSSSSGHRKAASPSPELPKSAADVRNFSEMVRMAPVLQRKADKMPAGELVHVCAAAARVGFYDPGLIREVTGALRRCLAHRARSLQPGEIVISLKALSELNAYDSAFFSTALAALRSSGMASLEARRRQELLEALKAVKHNDDADLIDDLARKSKAERYEAAKEELLKRNLSRMYGETQDLQGWAVDTERALLKRPRSQVTRERG